MLILQLEKPPSDTQLEFPPMLLLEEKKDVKEFNIFCHPGGKVLKVDEHCKPLSKEEERKIMNDKYRYWKSAFGIDKEKVDAGYAKCESSDSKFLFHVSESTNHGASGSPGIFADDTHPFVLLMFLGGFPKFFYSLFLVDGKDAPDLDVQYLIEYGIPMKKVSKLLQEVPNSAAVKRLHGDLFAGP